MSSIKKKLASLNNTLSLNIGCTSRCTKPKLSDVFIPKPKPNKPFKPTKPENLHNSTSSTSTKTTPNDGSFWDTNSTAEDAEIVNDTWHGVRGFGRVGDQSVAVEKDSDDPYLDFRQSMLQMIMEREIYSQDDLRELLNCFLQLNSPYYHGVIVRAFTEIWNLVFSGRHIKPSSSKSCYYYYQKSI